MKSTELIFRVTPATEASEAQLLGADLASRFPRLLLLRLDSIIGCFLHFFFFFCQSFKNFSGFLSFHCFFLSSSSSLLLCLPLDPLLPVVEEEGDGRGEEDAAGDQAEDGDGGGNQDEHGGKGRLQDLPLLPSLHLHRLPLLLSPPRSSHCRR